MEIKAGDDARFVKLMEDIARVAALKQIVKDRSMIYQVADKEAAAKANGVPLNTYYHIPYVEWAPIRAAYYRSIA